MTEPTLKQIIKLLSVFCQLSQKQSSGKIKKLIEAYLINHTKELHIDQFLNMFDFYLDQGINQNKDYYKNLSLKAVKAIGLINNIKNQLLISEKYWLIILLFKMLKSKKEILNEEYDFIETVAISFNIKDIEFYNIKNFILNPWEKIPEKNQLLIVNSNIAEKHTNYKHIYRENLSGYICILFIPTINLFLFYYDGTDQLFLNERVIVTDTIYALKKGHAITSYKMGLHNLKLKPVYYTEIGMKFFQNKAFKRITLDIIDISYTYKNSDEGIKKFNFSTESFLLVGIIGTSGAGKTTLLNILNSNLKPQFGEVLINGFDLHDQYEKRELQSLIGYVPQDDLLFDELSVFENLYFNAKLCFANKNNHEINQIVEKLLKDLELFHIKDLEVGNKTNQIISGGQRKRLNIGIELLREPAILLVDEPTSGLSSIDSLKIINILREQTLKGKLVIVNIHQPSSNLFRLLDQLIVVDKGGYIAYTGDPLESFVYFKTINQQINPAEKECPVCGNIEPETILEIIEEKAIDETGEISASRKITPAEWHDLFLENIDTQNLIKPEKKPLPEIHFKIPSALKQFKIFNFRNLKLKLSNKQYLWVSLLEAPLLALILGYFSKYNTGLSTQPEKYIFSENINIPAYLLMSIIVALFIGLLTSAKEIISERNILMREKYLNLSKISYINSKITFLFTVSAIQTILFVLAGNYILEIKTLTFSYWLILFSVACSANLLGLILSSGLNSTITIYILIPFLIIPQILLSGSIIKFDQLNSHLTPKTYPPLIADFMPSRWAFEALVVTQFKNNSFEKYYYPIEKIESDVSYQLNYLIPQLRKMLQECKSEINTHQNTSKIKSELDIILIELQKIKNKYPATAPMVNSIKDSKSIELKIQLLDNFLIKYKNILSNYLDETMAEKDMITHDLIKKMGNNQKYIQFRNKHLNYAIKELVLRSDRREKLIKKDNEIIRTFEPIYISPTHKLGRTPFFSSTKKVLNITIGTFSFNIMFIWIINLILYLILISDLLFILLKKPEVKKTVLSVIKKE